MAMKAMKAMKGKVVAKTSSQLFKGTKGGRGARKQKIENKKQEEEEINEEVGEKPEEEEVAEAEQEEQPEEQENEEEAFARKEAETTAARKKELKAMAVGDLKELVTGKGLETGKKEDMIAAVAKLEAKEREQVRANQAKIRGVMTKKLEELEALSVPELRDLCIAAGAKGVLTKQARVELLMKQWQEDDGVNNALKTVARDAREANLVAMDKAALKKLTAKTGVDALVKETMVDRLIRHEVLAGSFAKPVVVEEKEEETTQAVSKPTTPKDMVAALLAEEENRKKEKEQKKQEEEAAAGKMKELWGKSMDELKKQLAKKGAEATGKKEELVQTLYTIKEQEDKAEARKAKLKALNPEDLKARLTSKGLEVGKKDAMVDTLLKHEARLRDEAAAWEAKTGVVLEKKKVQLDEKKNGDLKDLCASKGLKTSGGKPELVEYLLEGIRASGEADKLVEALKRDTRREELMAMEKVAVLKLCEAINVDPLVKEVMVERILTHEDEFGAPAEKGEERPAKRARTTKK